MESICPGVIQGRARTNNLLGDLVLLERDNKNTLSVEGVELIMSDIMATNGVIHVVNDVIIPSAAKRLSDVLKQRKLTKLLTMLESAKLVIILTLIFVYMIAIIRPSTKIFQSRDEDNVLPPPRWMSWRV